jgi:hypothetical protein
MALGDGIHPTGGSCALNVSLARTTPSSLVPWAIHRFIVSDAHGETPQVAFFSSEPRAYVRTGGHTLLPRPLASFIALS